MCQKQCRDENSFKCHCMSEFHQRQMQIFGENPDRIIDGFSEEFERTFRNHMRRFHRFSRIAATVIYKFNINDRHHVHMNSTNCQGNGSSSVVDTLFEMLLQEYHRWRCSASASKFLIPKPVFVTDLNNYFIWSMPFVTNCAIPTITLFSSLPYFSLSGLKQAVFEARPRKNGIVEGTSC